MFTQEKIVPLQAR